MGARKATRRTASPFAEQGLPELAPHPPIPFLVSTSRPPVGPCHVPPDPPKTAMKNAFPLVAVCALSLAACGGGEEPAEESMPETPTGTVTIVEPAQGSTVTGPNVTVRLSTTNVPIVPAGDLTPGTGHHHLYLDADVASMTAPVPTVPGSIVHMGNAASEFTFENVTPGQHRLIAVVADGVHVPLTPAVVDTVTFTVQ